VHIVSTVILVGVILVAAVVMGSGVWVGSVLIRAVARMERPQPRAETPVTDERAE
jgi:hypothetical protein